MAFAALLATGLAAPVTARAGCSHPYVVSRFDVANGVEPLDLLLGERPVERLPQAPPRPCSGPSCSKTPVAPLNAGATAPERAEQRGCLSDQRVADGSMSACLPPEEKVSQPLRLGASVFHPPRSSR